MPVRNLRMDDDVIVFSQLAEQTKVTLIVSASNTLAFTSSNTFQSPIGVSNSTLSVTGSVTVNLKYRTASSTIVFTSDGSNQALRSFDIFDTLTLGQSLSVTRPHKGLANSSLNLTQSARSIIKAGLVNNSLALSQSVISSGPIIVEAATNITNPIDEVDLTVVGLEDSVTVETILNIAIISYVSFAQPAVRTLEAAASNHISLTHSGEDILDGRPVSVLQLTHSTTVDSVEFAIHTLDLTQTLISNGVIARSPSNALALDDIVTFYKIGDLCDYTPGVGAGPAAPSMTPPVLTRRSTILLTYPLTAPTTTIELRAPQFDDVEQYEFRRINRKTRGGTLQIFRDNAWPASERLTYSFDNLKEQKKQDLLQFLQQTIGQEIGLLDYESRKWRGVIITPTTQAGNEDRAGNSITIQFEGVIDPGGFSVNLVGSGFVVSDVTDIPPGFQVNISASLQLFGDIIRD